MPGNLWSQSLQETAKESKVAPFDCIVVGGGTSGLMAALRLLELGLRVVVAEAGAAVLASHALNTDLRYNRPALDGLRDDLAYAPALVSGGRFGQNVSALGGRALFWNGAAPRYEREIFADWPLHYDELEVHYRWVEEAFRISMRLGQTPLANKVISMLQASGFAAMPLPFAADFGQGSVGMLPCGIASGLGVFLRRATGAIQSGRIRLLTNATVTALVLQDGHCVGVEINNQSALPILTRSVFLAAGCTESIRLAQLAGLEDPDNRIGTGLQEHLFYRAYIDAPQIFDPKIKDVCAIYVPCSKQDGIQWELHAPGRRLMTLDDGTTWSPQPGAPYQIMIRAFAATERRLENRLNGVTGPLGSAMVNFSLSGRDLAIGQQMTDDAQRIAAALGGNIAESRMATPGMSFHEAGGLAMGTSPENSVVSKDGVFHAVPNLVCGDAAAFPCIGPANPHLTLGAVARRQADALGIRLKATTE